MVGTIASEQLGNLASLAAVVVLSKLPPSCSVVDARGAYEGVS